MKAASRIKMAATVASVVRAATRPGAPSISERVQAVPRLVRSTVDRTYAGTTLKRLGLVAGAVAYIASPVDLLPEAVLPVVGAADDAVVISWAISAFFEETDRFIAWEAGRGVRRSQASRDADGGHASTSVPTDTPRATGPVTRGSVADSEGVRRAATGYVLESVRRRLER